MAAVQKAFKAFGLWFVRTVRSLVVVRGGGRSGRGCEGQGPRRKLKPSLGDPNASQRPTHATWPRSRTRPLIVDTPCSAAVESCEDDRISLDEFWYADAIRYYVRLILGISSSGASDRPKIDVFTSVVVIGKRKHSNSTVNCISIDD